MRQARMLALRYAAISVCAVAAAVSTAHAAGQYADINGLHMYYEVHGTGSPVVVLHGAFGWAIEYPDLAKNHTVIAVELQGHGHTADVDRPLTYEKLADDVAALLQQLKISSADFFAYSMGGNVALCLAMRHPALARKVVILGSHAGSIDQSYNPEVAAQFKGLPADFAPPVLKEPYDRMAPNPAAWPVLVRKIKQMGLSFAGFAEKDLRAIGAQVLIMLGDRDGVSPEHAVWMYRVIPHAQLAVFPGGDHFLLFTNTGAVLQAVSTFLDAPPAQQPTEGAKQ